MADSVKLTNTQARDGFFALRRLMQSKRSPLKALKLRQLARALVPAVDDFQAEQEKLWDEYAVKTKGGKLVTQTVMVDGPDGSRPLSQVSIRPDVVSAFQREFKELGGATIEIPAAYVLNMADLGAADVEAEVLFDLGPLLEDRSGEDSSASGSPPPGPEPSTAELERFLNWCRKDSTRFPGTIADLERELACRP